MKRRADARAVSSHSTFTARRRAVLPSPPRGRPPLGGPWRPTPGFPEGSRSDGGLVRVTVGQWLGRMSSHGTKGIACHPHRPGAAPRGPKRRPEGRLRISNQPSDAMTVSGRSDLNRRPLGPLDMGLAVLTGQWGSDGPVLGAPTCWLSGQVHSVWSQSGPKRR